MDIISTVRTVMSLYTIIPSVAGPFEIATTILGLLFLSVAIRTIVKNIRETYHVYVNMLVCIITAVLTTGWCMHGDKVCHGYYEVFVTRLDQTSSLFRNITRNAAAE